VTRQEREEEEGSERAHNVARLRQPYASDSKVGGHSYRLEDGCETQEGLC